MTHLEIISQELGLQEKYVKNVMELLAEGSTVPFIARYRKEMTGTMDEVAIGNIKEWVEKLTELDKRRESILKTIAEQGKLTPELKAKIEKAWTMTELEDLYLPYKVKRKTRATKAREAGLEPLADLIFKQFEKDPESRAEQFLNDTILSVDAALEGARDIIAEWVSEDTRARDKVRACFKKDGMMSCAVVKGKEKEGEKYRDYFDFQKKITFLQSHQWLAIRRAENEGFIRVDMMPEEGPTVDQLNRMFVKGHGECSYQVELAVKDSYKRLLQPQIETEFRAAGKELADNEAIRVFGENVRQLLLDAPVGEKRVLALDPGFRTGCKLVILNEAGDLAHNEAIYPHPPQHDTMGAAHIIQKLVAKYDIEVFAVGNGTAGRETQDFLKSVRLEKKIPIFMVNESGASIYSASEVAREEFPTEDITVRGAVSIGRRLKDPLAELVKIDPKSIGVGQYQHDVDQKKLNENLDSTVISCVNKVGVNLNTASKHLLAYVSGLGPVLAQNIVKYRSENGFFKSKAELKKVSRLGDKAYEQCAGFLRVRGAANPLDASGIHPESYPIVNQMAKDLGCTVKDLMAKPELRKSIVLQKYVSATVGMPTLMDIMKEFENPGQDPRSEPKEFSFDANIRDIKDIAEGMMLSGIVTNITDFGAFVDIGIKQNGLIHKSQMANRFVKDPAEVVRLGQNVHARVVGVDLERGRVQLSLKD